ncbi:hypothetical protein EC9_32800 [Rosistilla ulvae]|uniref:Uncharacterized protein n=1 Tax=Rosistilla ulvae TaxID=1930277 RepID=A0A517M2I1_9BACT|nr:hypothetical protein EC9_32800 [Rosistilla ulvae]
MPPPLNDWVSTACHAAPARGAMPPRLNDWVSTACHAAPARGAMPPRLNDWVSTACHAAPTRGAMPPPLNDWVSTACHAAPTRGAMPPPLNDWVSTACHAAPTRGALPPRLNDWLSAARRAAPTRGALPSRLNDWGLSGCATKTSRSETRQEFRRSALCGPGSLDDFGYGLSGGAREIVGCDSWQSGQNRGWLRAFGETGKWGAWNVELTSRRLPIVGNVATEGLKLAIHGKSRGRSATLKLSVELCGVGCRHRGLSSDNRRLVRGAGDAFAAVAGASGVDWLR